jgi:hypothetical protein
VVNFANIGHSYGRTAPRCEGVFVGGEDMERPWAIGELNF